MADHTTPAEMNKQEDEISVKEMILKVGSLNKYLLRKWPVIIGVAIVGLIIGIAYASMKKTTYTAELTFVLEEEGGGAGLGQYSTLAAIAGIDMNSSGGLFQGDNIIELYRSRLMIQKTLLTPVQPGSKQLLIDRYLQFNELKDAWEDGPLKSLNFEIPAEKFTIKHDSIMQMVVKDINKNYLTVDKPDKKLSIISVRTKAKDDIFAKIFTQTIVANVNDFYVQTKTKKSIQNVTLLQHQLDSIRRVLHVSINGSAAAMDVNPNPNPALQSLRSPAQKKQIDVQANTAIYAEVVKNLELSRGMLQRETPLIQVIDQPILPLPNDKLGRGKAGIIGALIAGLLAVFMLTVIKIYQKIIYS